MIKKLLENNLVVYGIGTVGSLLFLVAAYQDLSDFISRQAVVGYNLVFFMLAFGLFLNEFGKPRKEDKKEEFIVTEATQNSSQEYPKFVDTLYNPDAKNEWEIEEESEHEEVQTKPKKEIL